MIGHSSRRRGISATLAAFALAIALTACGQSGGGNDGPGRDGGGATKNPRPTPTLTEEFVVGTWGDPDDADDPYLEFAEDGTVTGSDGCNRLVGNWTVENETVVISELAATLMACAGVNTWLSAAATAKIEPDDDDELAFFDQEGVPIGTLDRDGPDFEPDRNDD